MEIICFVIGLFVVSAFPSLVALYVVWNNLTEDGYIDSSVIKKITSSIVMQTFFIMFFIAYTFDFWVWKFFIS